MFDVFVQVLFKILRTIKKYRSIEMTFVPQNIYTYW